MADVTDDPEGGDMEARFREALEKGRRQAEQLRRNAWAVWRAMEGWQRVRTEEEWVKIWEESREEYKSGRFFLERLGAERHLDPKLMATLWSLRQRLIAEWGISTAAEMMLLDLALLGYYHALRVQGWVGDLALHIEHEFFAQDALAENGERRGRRQGRFSVEEDVRRLSEHLMPLMDRANRMLIRNLKAIKELRERLAPAIAIGQAEQVTVTTGQNGRARKTRAGH
jgi:hypothetical protein